MPSPELWQIAALTGISLVASTLDAIGGGGGLLTLPALMALGLPPHYALGTNKGQSVFGSGAALVRFARSGAVDRARAAATFPAGLLGSLGGAALVLILTPGVLGPVAVALLVAAAVFVGASRHRSPVTQRVRSPSRVIAAAIAFIIGAYDGFFGPGTGTFAIVAFTMLLGDPLSRATAEAKVVNFASNLAAVLLFAAQGTVVWSLATPMAAAQVVGGTLGAHIVIQRGDRLVRGVVVVVALCLAAKLALAP